MSGFQSRSVFKNAYRSDIIRVAIICGSFYVFLDFIKVIFKLSESGTDFFFTYIKNPLLLPLSVTEFTKQFWSLFTFGFIDTSFWALFGNMIWLWIFGSLIEDKRGTNRVLPIFWFGFIFGGIILLILNQFIWQKTGLYMSTLGGVAAVAAAAVSSQAKSVFYSIFNKGVPLYFFGIAFLALSIFIHLEDSQALVLFFGGGLLGFLSQNVLSSFFDKCCNWLRRLRAFFSSNDNFVKKKPPKKISTGSLNQRINEVLTKLNTFGKESLTQEEIQFLEFHNKM
jgi:membrane associated rhomboid family serine protease